MLKQIAGYLILLVAAGTGLTLYLPTFEPDNKVTRQQLFYQINQASLKQPLPMADTLLSATQAKDSLYGIGLGLFGQLPQAIGQGQKLALTENPSIVKLTDGNRYWYLLMIGPFESAQQANKRRFDIAQAHSMTATLIKWPLKVQTVAQGAATQQP
jgi:cell division protein FtsN